LAPTTTVIVGQGREIVSYATDPNAPGGSGPVRPNTVTISSYLLYLVAALQVVSALVTFAVASDYQRVVKDAYADVEGGDAIASITSISLIGTAIFGLLIGAGLVALAIFNNRGKNPSRITTWVIGGLFLCCGGFGLITVLAGGSMDFGGPAAPNAPSQAELQEMITDAMPSWYTPVTTTVSIIGLLALLGALILLALPPSNEFFRKRPPEWEPPAGQSGGYLAYPAYPGAPGTQPAPGTPGTDPAASGTAPAAPGATPSEPPAAPPASPSDPSRPEDPPRASS
jgi:hypothetical protein